MERFKSITIVFLLAVGLLILASPNSAFAEGSRKAGSQNPMRITTEENIVSVHAGERILLRYRYKNVPFKPYVQQLFSPNGVNVLRDAPSDHLHHHGLMFAVAVDGVNFWEERQDAGRQAHRSFTDVRIDERDDVPRASFTEHIDWLNPRSQELLLKEHRTVEVCQAKDLGVTLLSWRSILVSPSGRESTMLTGDRYFGLGMRFLKSMDTGGQFRNADGKTGVNGTNDIRAAWCAYTASANPVRSKSATSNGANGKPVTIAMFDHPDNERYPATWFTMEKPFAYLSLTMNLNKQPLKVALDKPLVVRYAVAVWDGRVEADQIDQLYRQWVAQASPGIAGVSKPNQAQWEKIKN